MEFISRSSWWAIELIQLLCMIPCGLGVLGYGSKANALTAVSFIAYILIVVQFFISGPLGGVISLILLFMVIMPTAYRLVHAYLRAQHLVHSNYHVAMDIARAAAKRSDDFRETIGNFSVQNLQKKASAYKQRDTIDKHICSILASSSLCSQYGLSSPDIETLIREIRMALGPVKEATMTTIASDPNVIEAFKNNKECKDIFSEAKFGSTIRRGKVE